MEQSSRFTSIIKNAVFAIGLVFFFLFPLIFVTSTSEFNEYNKLFVVIILSGLVLLVWSLRSLLERKFMISKTPFDLAFVVLSIVFILATFFSANKTLSIFGAFNNWHLTVVEVLAFIGLFYGLVTNIDGWKKIQALVLAFMTSSLLVSFLTLATYLGLFSFTQGSFLQVLSIRGFSPAGNVFSLISLLMVSVLIGIFQIKNNLKGSKLQLGIYLVMTLIMSLNLGLWLAPYIPGVNTQQGLAVRLNFDHSWQIATSSIRTNALFGSGPSTYAHAFLAFRPSSINMTDNWNIIFNQAGSEYMTWLTTLGIAGFGALVLLMVVLIMTAKKVLFGVGGFTMGQKRTVDEIGARLVGIKPALVVGVLLFTVFYFFSSSTVMSLGVFFMTLIMWMLVEKESASSGETDSALVEEVVLNLSAIRNRFWGNDSTDRLKSSSVEGKTVQLMQWIVSIPLVFLVLVTGFYTINDYRSNLAYASSIRALNENKQAREVYEAQQRAIQLNPSRDTYHRAYANTNITLARVIANQAGETITETQRDDVLSLISQAIREVRIITELLDPVSAVNWQVRGSVYQNLLGVASGADRWALDAYQNAVRRAPTDPRLRLNVGSLFFRLAINTPDEGTTGDAPGEDVAQTPQTKQANLARAEAAFLEAITLKSDYANAHYNLAAVYIEAKRFDLAEKSLSTTLGLVEQDSADYERVQADLEAVRKQIPTQQTAQ